jgi:subtilisin family serine protease
VTSRIRVAIIDSGIHAGHPHVGSVAGGVAIASDGSEGDDFIDRIGHGTAVAAVIREKAPDADLFAVKIFDRKLSTDVHALVHAIRWCAAHEMRWINLSLGTTNLDHEEPLQQAVDEARAQGAMIVSAFEHDGARWLPGSLPGAIPVLLDWDCPREEYRIGALDDGRTVYRASGYPRPIPGVPPERNLKGISFAVANVTGFLASGVGV